jgi:FkbM family methyltransferase
MVLHSLFQFRALGFYVDIGAHHPVRHSNTYYFYQRGWRGINIDAMPGSMEAFDRLRPEDINLEVGIAQARAALTYYRFREPAVNAFSLSQERIAELSASFGFLEKLEIQAVPLVDILREHLPRDRHIDFLSIDVEGLDLEVLSSNDWQAYRPTIVLAEDLDAFTLGNVLQSPITAFLGKQGYEPCAKMHHTILYIDRTHVTGNNFREE